MSPVERLRSRLTSGWELLAEGWWARWYRVAGWLGARRRRVNTWGRRRREAIAERWWSAWYGSVDRLGSSWRALKWRIASHGGPSSVRRRDPRPERLRLRIPRPERLRLRIPRPQRLPLRAFAFAGVGVYAALVVTVAAVARDDAVSSEPSPTASASPQPPPEPTGIIIPDVRGSSSAEAQVQLERQGLTFGGATAAVGWPGEVLATDPSVGSSVPPGTIVTVVVGVEPERLDDGT